MHKDVIDSLIGWIDEHIDKPLKISDVAEKSGYSKWHLQRMFQQIIGETLGNYIRDRKLELAANELLHTKNAVIDISFKYGYDSQQSFSRTFSRKYHLPPQAYRRMHQSQPA